MPCPLPRPAAAAAAAACKRKRKKKKKKNNSRCSHAKRDTPIVLLLLLSFLQSPFYRCPFTQLDLLVCVCVCVCVCVSRDDMMSVPCVWRVMCHMMTIMLAGPEVKNVSASLRLELLSSAGYRLHGNDTASALPITAVSGVVHRRRHRRQHY